MCFFAFKPLWKLFVYPPKKRNMGGGGSSVYPLQNVNNGRMKRTCTNCNASEIDERFFPYGVWMSTVEETEEVSTCTFYICILCFPLTYGCILFQISSVYVYKLHYNWLQNRLWAKVQDHFRRHSCWVQNTEIVNRLLYKHKQIFLLIHKIHWGNVKFVCCSPQTPPPLILHVTEIFFSIFCIKNINM